MSQNNGSSHSELKQVFTTGEAAEICKVSQQTIIRCFDSGRLKGFRVPGQGAPGDHLGGHGGRAGECRVLGVGSGLEAQAERDEGHLVVLDHHQVWAATKRLNAIATP